MAHLPTSQVIASTGLYSSPAIASSASASASLAAPSLADELEALLRSAHRHGDVELVKTLIPSYDPETSGVLPPPLPRGAGGRVHVPAELCGLVAQRGQTLLLDRLMKLAHAGIYGGSGSAAGSSEYLQSVPYSASAYATSPTTLPAEKKAQRYGAEKMRERAMYRFYKI